MMNKCQVVIYITSKDMVGCSLEPSDLPGITPTPPPFVTARLPNLTALCFRKPGSRSSHRDFFLYSHRGAVFLVRDANVDSPRSTLFRGESMDFGQGCVSPRGG